MESVVEGVMKMAPISGPFACIGERNPHTQCSYVLSGRFRYTVEGEDAILVPGDSVVVPGGLVHGTECLEAGVLLDIFTPARQDFLK